MNSTGIGAKVVRREDKRFITGRGRYTDDVNLPGMTWAVMVRSPHAHAWIRSVNTSAARSAPGVLTVLTGEDAIKDELGGLPCHVFPPGSGHYRPTHMVLAYGKVRYVGETVAVVVAESLLQAKHAAELITVDYEPLESVTLAGARKDNAPRIWEEARENVS